MRFGLTSNNINLTRNASNSLAVSVLIITHIATFPLSLFISDRYWEWESDTEQIKIPSPSSARDQIPDSNIKFGTSSLINVFILSFTAVCVNVSGQEAEWGERGVNIQIHIWATVTNIFSCQGTQRFSQYKDPAPHKLRQLILVLTTSAQSNLSSQKTFSGCRNVCLATFESNCNLLYEVFWTDISGSKG